jgi:uncharacterized protein (DUF58 family)
MIYPTRRAVLLTALGAPVALVLGLVAPGLWLAAVGWAVFLFGLLLVDGLLAPSRHALEIGVDAPAVMGTGQDAEAAFRLRFTGRRAPARFEASLEAGHRLAVVPARARVEVEDAVARVVMRLTPLRRGEAPLTALWLRWQGPLGLVWKQRAAPLDRLIRITPNVQAVKDEAIRMFSRDAAFGIRSQLEQGDGTEFQALREFATGMDPRTIDWKQSARHRQLLAKEFRTERNHPMIFALDTGRLMCEPVDGLPRIDHALNGALLLSYVALKTGDRVGFFAFDAKPRLISGAVSGVGAYPLLQRLAASVDYSAEETNFTLGLTQLAGELERRSLVVIFTDFADSTSAELMIDNLGRLLKRHLVLFVVFRDEELETLASAEPQDPDDVSRAVIADALLKEREVVIGRLKRMGAHIVDAPARRIGPELLSGYLDLKRRDLL